MKSFLRLCLGMGLAGVLALGACAPKTATNTNGTPVTASEQVAGGAYVAYIAADTAWLGYLTAPSPSKAVVLAVEPRRKAARAALDKFAAASVQSDAAAITAAQAAFNDALTAFVNQLSQSAGITVPPAAP